MNLDRTTETHLLFRGSAEVAKLLRLGALVLEVAAACASLHAILWPGFDAGIWRPIAIFLCVALGTVLRTWAASFTVFSERCRISSTRAFASGDTITPAEYSASEADAPPLARRLALRLPAVNLDKYFEPTVRPGRARLREIYAHSAFYSWRLNRIAGRIYLVAGSAVVLIALAMTYYLAAAAIDAPDVHRSLDAVFSVLLAFIGLRPLSAGITHWSSARELRPIADALLAAKLAGEGLNRLADNYDRALAVSPTISTVIYRYARDGLQEKWAQRREALV